METQWYLSFGLALLIQIIALVGAYWRINMNIEKLTEIKLSKTEHEQNSREHRLLVQSLRDRIRELETSKVEKTAFEEIKQQIIVLDTQMDIKFAGIENMYKTIIAKFDQFMKPSST